MDTSVCYQVVFSGRLRKGCTAADVKRNLANRWHLPVEKIEQLFATGRAVLKQTPSLEEAKRFALQLAASGAIATIEPNPAARPAKKPASTSSATPAKAVGNNATLKPFKPLGSRIFLQPLLVLGATREILLNLLHVAMILTLLGVVFIPSLSGNLLGQFIPLPSAVQGLQLLLIIIAGLLLLYLLKPLLALATTEHPGIPLAALQEPGLYDFIEDVCEQIGAPLPSEIRLQEDASIRVSYRRGPQGWLENSTVLTLGLPLIAGLNCSQLAGLIARQYGRYRNNSAPRATAVVLHGHEWLQRAANGEDIVDRTLKRWHESGQIGHGLLRLAQLLLAPSRRMVNWRLRLSSALDRRAVHRIVAEEDELALSFTGKEEFIRLLDQASLLAFVGGNLLSGLKEQWQSKGVLPGNLVHLMVLRSRQFPVSMPQKLRLIQERQKAAIADILPSDNQRLKRIGDMTIEPEDKCLSPAAAMFRQYSKLTRAITLRYYHHRLHLPVSPYRLQLVAGKKSLEHLQQQRLDSYFHKLYIDFLPLKLRQRIRDISSLAEAKQQWSLGLSRIQSEYEKARQAREHFDISEATLVDASTREEIHLAGLWHQWGEEKLNGDALEEVHQNARDSEREYQQALHGMEQYLKAYSLRMGAVLAALSQNEVAALEGVPELRKEVQLLLETLELIENVQTQLRELKMQTLLLETLLSQRSSGKRQKLNDRIEQQAADVQQLTRAIGFALKNAAYPFTDGKADQLIKYVLQNALSEESPQGDFDRGNDTVEVLAQVQRRALVRLITITEQLERALGFRG